jgi:hypothetical protein
MVIPGATASDFHSPRTAALGGAGRAGPLLNDAVFLNPSFASFLPTYAVGLHYGSISTGSTGDAPGSGGRNYSIQIQDGRNEIFQAGAAYTLREDGSFIHLGVSKAFFQRVGFGLSGKFYFNSRTNVNGQELVFSTTGVLANELQASFTVDNLIQSQSSRSRGLYREFVLGTKVNLQGIVLGYFDPHVTPDLPSGESFGFESGLEFVIQKDFFFRLGMFKNSNIPLIARYGRGFGIGAGWVAPRISIDYGIERVLEPRLFIAHTLGATMYF